MNSLSLLLLFKLSALNLFRSFCTSAPQEIKYLNPQGGAIFRLSLVHVPYIAQVSGYGKAVVFHFIN